MISSSGRLLRLAAPVLHLVLLAAVDPRFHADLPVRRMGLGVKAWIYRGEQHKVKNRRRETKKTA